MQQASCSPSAGRQEPGMISGYQGRANPRSTQVGQFQVGSWGQPAAQLIPQAHNEEAGMRRRLEVNLQIKVRSSDSKVRCGLVIASKSMVAKAGLQ